MFLIAHDCYSFIHFVHFCTIEQVYCKTNKQTKHKNQKKQAVTCKLIVVMLFHTPSYGRFINLMFSFSIREGTRPEKYILAVNYIPNYDKKGFRFFIQDQWILTTDKISENKFSYVSSSKKQSKTNLAVC